MADDADNAELHIAAELNYRILSARPGPPSGATHCADCGDPLPEERRRLVPDAVLCVGCKRLSS